MTQRNQPWGYQNAGTGKSPEWELHPETTAVRGGLMRSGFGETGEALYLSSGFTYDSAEQAASAQAEADAQAQAQAAADAPITMTREEVERMRAAIALCSIASPPDAI